MAVKDIKSVHKVCAVVENNGKISKFVDLLIILNIFYKCRFTMRMKNCTAPLVSSDYNKIQFLIQILSLANIDFLKLMVEEMVFSAR